MRRNPHPTVHPGAGAVLLLALLCAACGSPTPEYLPLAPARWWYYAVDETILEEPHELRYLVKNLGDVSLDGEPALVQAVQAGSREYLRRAGGGVVRIARARHDRPELVRDEPARVILPPTLAVGRSWQVPSSLGLIESRTFERADRVIMRRIPLDLEKRVVAVDAAVSAPAGNFTDCLRIDGRGSTAVRTDRGNSRAEVTVETTEWYAPGVGLVRLERHERSTSTFLKDGSQRWQLVAYGR